MKKTQPKAKKTKAIRQNQTLVTWAKWTITEADTKNATEPKKEFAWRKVVGFHKTKLAADRAATAGQTVRRYSPGDIINKSRQERIPHKQKIVYTI